MKQLRPTSGQVAVTSTSGRKYGHILRIGRNLTALFGAFRPERAWLRGDGLPNEPKTLL